jgi:hypothetical protein
LAPIALYPTPGAFEAAHTDPPLLEKKIWPVPENSAKVKYVPVESQVIPSMKPVTVKLLEVAVTIPIKTAINTTNAIMTILHAFQTIN